MRATRGVMAICVATIGIAAAGRAAQAADPEVSVTLVPAQMIIVEGDHDNFQAHHWMPQGYTGGVEEFLLHHTLPDGTVLSVDSHALIDQNDLGADILLKKEALGFFKFDYSEFRKYFDPTGGVYYRFSTYPSTDTNKDLKLDLGTFGVETGLTLEGMPELTFLYEREFKDGAKSRLTWTSVKEGSTTRKIGPSWQEIDEIADTFALKATHEVAGVALTGEQRWERVRTDTFREERSLATTGAAADAKIARQDQAPQADLMTTLLGGERSFLNDAVFVASAYRFAHLDSREFERLAEFNETGTLESFGHNKLDARADNDYDSHTWVGNMTLIPWPWLSLGAQLKSELLKREGNSTYPDDAAPADGIANTTARSLINHKATRWGEGLTLRFFGIPRTALYTELELEQARVLLREDRKSVAGQSAASASDTFNRETVTDVRRGTGTIGGRINPWPFLDLTAHVRHRRNNNDYDDQRESVASGTALSAFLDAQNQHTDEFTMRATLKPYRWLRSSVRYQFRDDDYDTRFEAQQAVKAGMRSHIYTYDVTVQPRQDLLTTASFSRQDAATTTPAAQATTANTPTFNADVSTWLLSADYTPQSAVTLNGTFLYSWASNFNDYTASGLPLGADFNRLDLTTGVTWATGEDTSVKAEYGLYSYLPNSIAERGNYHAHLIWLEVSKEF